MTTRYHSTSAASLAAFLLVCSQIPLLAQPSAGSALSFDGVDDLVIVPNHPLLELTDGTLELWFKPDWTPGSLAYDPALIAKRLGPNLTRYSLHVDRNLAGVLLANGTSVSTVPFTFTPGEWAHLALVDVGSTAQVYVNGKLVGSTTNGFGTLLGLPLHLGSDGAGQFFRGQMDEVRIWSVARSATDLRYNMSRALAGTEAGLVAYWRMDEGLGLTVLDATANRLDGLVYGPVWTPSEVTLVNTTGAFGLALDLTASRGTHVQVASAPSLALSNRFTFEAWIKPRTAQCSTILTRGDGVNFASTDYIFQVGTDGTNCGAMKLGLMVAGQWATSESSVPLSAWTHVAVSYDGILKRFYINGMLDSAVAGTGGAYQNGSALFIGKQGVAGTNYFDGTLDEVRVWNSVRSATQIQTNLNHALPANEAGLVGYWRFDEQAGVRAFDSSGRARHGTLAHRPLRVRSFWAPVLTTNGATPLTAECHTVFVGAVPTASGTPIALEAGVTHTLALKADGSVVGWGAGGPGTSGDRNYGQSTVPQSATNVVALAAGYQHSLALKADSTVLAWGWNDYGQTTVPTLATNVVAIAAGVSFSLALNRDGTVVAWGDSGRTNVPASATSVVAIAAGNSHSLALKAGGSVIAWGNNAYGETTIPGSAVDVVSIAAGSQHNLALRADGTVVAWGRSDFGQIDVPVSASNILAVAAGGDHSLALNADGTLIGWGRNDYEQINIPSGATSIVAVAASGVYSMALRSDGVLLAWGRNDYGTIAVPGNLKFVNLPVIACGSVNTTMPGTYVLTYSAINTAGSVSTATRTVVVMDTKPPALTLVDGSSLNLDVGMPFADPGATASDACEGNLTAGILRTGTVNATVPGRYTLTYTVADSSGNTATTNRTVLVRGWPAVLGFTAFFSGTNVITGSPVVQFLADVNPNGLATVAFAQYGLSTAYPGRTTLVSLPANYDLSTFFATLDGLMPGLTYHFRIAASNSLGVAYGPDQTFTVPLLFSPGDLNGDGRVDQSELDGVLSNYWPYSPWLAMTNAASMDGGLFQFALTNAGGWNFSVLASTNLVDWSPLPNPAWPVWQFLDPAATNEPRRFYRLRWP